LRPERPCKSLMRREIQQVLQAGLLGSGQKTKKSGRLTALAVESDASMAGDVSTEDSKGC